jgi:hypothetical protein
MRPILLYSCFFFFALTSWSQKEVLDTIPEHPFRKSILFSTIVPGGGQIRNSILKKRGFKHAVWKVPLIYGAIGYATYTLIQNQQTQKSLKTEYMNRLEGSITDPRWLEYDDQGVLYLYRQYLDQRDLSILALGAIYLLQIVDAGVESHFIHFDVTDDLSIEVQPTVLYSQVPGININLKFK